MVEEVEREDPGDREDTTLVIGAWRFAGMGWLSAEDAALAATSAARGRYTDDSSASPDNQPLPGWRTGRQG